jgi:hypothetical protein
MQCSATANFENVSADQPVTVTDFNTVKLSDITNINYENSSQAIQINDAAVSVYTTILQADDSSHDMSDISLEDQAKMFLHIYDNSITRHDSKGNYLKTQHFANCVKSEICENSPVDKIEYYFLYKESDTNFLNTWKNDVVFIDGKNSLIFANATITDVSGAIYTPTWEIHQREDFVYLTGFDQVPVDKYPIKITMNEVIPENGLFSVTYGNNTKTVNYGGAYEV